MRPVIGRLLAAALVGMVVTPAIGAGPCEQAFEKAEIAYVKNWNDSVYTPVFERCKPLADNDSVDAQYTIGVMYLYGRGTKENNKAAVRYLMAAAEKNHPRAQTEIGNMYENGVKPIRKDGDKAIMWYQRAAAQGDAEGHYLLGLAINWFKGDSKLQAKHVRIAALKNHAKAQWALAEEYTSGKAVKRDLACARFWLRVAIHAKGRRWATARNFAKADLKKLEKSIEQKEASLGDALFEKWRQTGSFKAVSSQNRCI